MTLAGRLECEKGKLRNGRVMLRSRGAGRRLWGSGKGDYETAGSHGAATVRGTTWLVADRCGGSTDPRTSRVPLTGLGRRHC